MFSFKYHFASVVSICAFVAVFAANDSKFKDSGSSGDSSQETVAKDTSAEKKDSSTVFFSILYGKSPLKISGMKDVHLSDWKRFGTGSLEGRAEIKLSESNTENDLGTAFTFAGSSALSEKIDVLVTLPVVFNAEAIAVGLNLGINYKLFDKRFLTFGVAPEIGFHYAMLSATTIEMLPGKTGPIITDNYTFAAGDQITGTAKGVAGSLSAIASLNLTKSFAIEAKAGVQLGIFSEPVLEFGEGSDKKELDFDDPAVVEAVDGSTNPVKYEGKISTTGFLFGVGIKYAR